MIHPTTADTRVRRRLLAVLFAGTGITRIGFIAAITVTTLVAEDLLGSPTLAGLPGAVAVVGMALGTTPISTYMGRRGRRPGMVLGQVVAALGAFVAGWATGVGSFLALVVGLFVLGLGNSADRLARYAAAEVAPVRRRGSAIALIVWAGTVGSVLGPALLEPSQGLAQAFGVPGLAGPYLLAVVMFGLVATLDAAALRPDPLDLRTDDPGEPTGPPVTLRQVVTVPAAKVAVASLVIGQLVMILIMTMTPIHIRQAGGDLGTVGLVIAAHTLGMFGLSPLTGWLSDRHGRLPVVVAGQLVLAGAAAMAATADGAATTMLVVALFFLGLGWNFSFVAASALLVDDLPGEWRLRAQGFGDGLAWSSGAVAGVSSGILLRIGGFGFVSGVGLVLTAIPLAAAARALRRR